MLTPVSVNEITFLVNQTSREGYLVGLSKAKEPPLISFLYHHLVNTMKRARTDSSGNDEHRPLDEIDRELRDARSRVRALEKEQAEHPETISEKQRKERETLEKQFPKQFRDTIIGVDFSGYGTLQSVYTDTCFDENDYNDPAQFWDFTATFSKKSFTCRVDLATPSTTTDFNTCELCAGNPLRTWYRALDENNEDVGAALAAFYHACCEHTGSYSDTDPSDVF